MHQVLHEVNQYGGTHTFFLIKKHDLMFICINELTANKTKFTSSSQKSKHQSKLLDREYYY